MKLGVVVPTLTNYIGLADTLWSLKTKHDWEPFIQANWREGKSISEAWNNGIRQALAKGCDYILVTNDDVLFSHCTIDNLIDTFEYKCKQDIVLISARAHNEQIGWEPTKIFNLDPMTNDMGENPDFACFMIDRSTINNIGWIDEAFNPGYFNDNDYHRRINLLGYKAMSIGAAPYYHYVSVTGKHVMNTEIHNASQQVYINKWGGIMGNEQFLTPYNDPSLTPRDCR